MSYGIDRGHGGYKYKQYAEVGRNQVYLTENEEIALIRRYTYARNELHWYILTKAPCRLWFLELYRSTRSAGKSIAKLSHKFNPRVKGLSKQIEEDMIERLSLVGYMSDKQTGASGSAVTTRTIYDVGPSEWCYNEMEKLMLPTKKLAAMKAEISEYEDTLLRTMLMAAHEIANRSSSNILSIDESDAAQEVNLYFLESIRKYDPNFRTPEGERVKLCTYAYGRAERLIQEWILTNSRLVRVPRSKMGRILTVVKAYESIESSEANLWTITDEANKIQRGRCVLTDSNTFTIKEVDELIKILMSNYIHLDQPISKGDRVNHTTIGEMISNDDPCVTELIEARDKKEKLIEVIQANLNKIEYQIIMLRYFHDPSDKVPKALNEIGPLLESVYGSMKYSRESVRKIEKAAMSKLLKLWEIKRLW